ncbi:TPA: restriction endonuclease subunit S [Escherichia coli]|uniref:restriction endonuclease subunit S n=1 Tax=Escherichia TaxID=561 RepID=UPI000CF75F69|nr:MULTISPECIES: restriction endonuclease subunit S [unclassified Escherichia]MEC9533327.1 restriction endonuclease subunit S [Escherichia marmotae]HAI3447805.1 restriction endonuclease subunit S [Escherichia coli]MBB2400825.1 restriction endonuclease subunit S [Escherichia sp. 14.0993]MEC9849013.1 restriction endonuclease subunit S [Escherichia marmotae]MEC9928097.1 restriction endonuclease subunit S [Escherichia marmotae]
MSAGKLPEGWVETYLSEICSKPQYGYTTKSSPTGNVKFLRTTDITKGTVDWSTVPYCLQNPDDILKYQLQDRDIVISRAGSVGFSFLVKNPPNNVVFASYLIRFKPFDNISELYLKRFLESGNYWVQLASMSAGNALQNVNAQKLSTLIVPIPPLAEQKIIAEKLDTLLAQVDSTKARLEQIPQILKRFRQAVLSSAVSGKLIDKSFENKSEKLNSFVSIDIGNAFKSSEFSDEGVPLLRGQNIEPGALRWDDTKKFPIDKLQKYSHLFINEGDIILAMDRPIISSGLKIAKAKKSDLPCVLVQRVARFKDFENLIPDYLYLLLNDVSFINYIQPNQTGSDIPHISGKQILNFECNVPSIPEQREIVRRVEQLFAYADTIEKQVNNALARVNNLTQSILAKAFRGELTAQWRAENPELISGENSAAALLEKIKAERAASGGKKASRKKS